MIERRQFKGTSVFAIFLTLIEIELRDIVEYINETSTELKAKQEKLNKDYEKANNEIEEDLEHDVHSFFEDNINKYFKVFPIYTYNPLLLIIYGQFENWLKNLCELDARKGFSKVKVKDLAGNNYIEKSRKYLELVAELNLDDTKSEWQKITQMQKLRNCIAHNQSNIIKDKSIPIEKQELYKMVSSDKRLDFNKTNGDFYIKESAFLLEAIELIKNYLIKVIEKLKVKKVVAKNIATPYDNTKWGLEKTESLLNDIILSLNFFDEIERITNKIDGNYLDKLKENLECMVFNLTKIYSFFANGKWEVIDQKYIVDEREKGLKKLKSLYDIK